MLPLDTFLGKLEFFEVYDEFDGPKCFSVINNLKQFYLVYWAGFLDDKRSDSWLYSSISENRLDRVRRNEETVRNVFVEPELNTFYVLTSTSDRHSFVDFISRSEICNYNLPPQTFVIEEDEIEVVSKESDWHFELKIRKRTDIHALPDRTMVTRVIDAFSEIIECLMNDGTRKIPKVFPKSAIPGSFEVKLETNDSEAASIAIEEFRNILSDAGNLSENLKSATLDPYRVKELIEIIEQHNLQLVITPKTFEYLNAAIMIEKDTHSDLMELLEDSTSVLVDSIMVPQANCLERVIDVVKLRAKGEQLDENKIEGINSKRQVDYHTDAAYCLGLLKKNLSVTSAGRYLVSKESKISQYEFLADRFESSDFGWGWIKWSGVKNMCDLNEDTAQQFISECVNGLNNETAARRSSTIARWLRELKPYRRDYSNQEKSDDEMTF